MNQIRPAGHADAGEIARIYNHHIRETIVTFEEQEISSQEVAARIEKVASESLPWLVAEDAGVIVGYAYATKWHGRSAYRYSVESTIYLDHRHTGKGTGTRLYGELLAMLRAKPLHVVIGGIALPNPASIALHERLGFAKVAHFKEVGFKFGKWIDVGYWQTSKRERQDG